MSTWAQDMQDVFTDSVAEWGDTLLFQSNQIPCEKTELSIGYQFEVSGINRMADTAIDVLRSDAISIGLYAPDIQENPTVKRPVVQVDGMNFTVLLFKDDIKADPTIKLMCVRLQ